MLKRFAAVVAVLILAGCPKSTTSTDASGLGQAAGAFLKADPYSSLVVEIQVMTGFEPSNAAKTNLVNFLNTYLNKPGGVTYVVETIAAGGKAQYSLAELKAIEAANRQRYGTGATAVAYFLFVDGGFSTDSGSSRTLGVAHGDTSVAMFGGTLHDLSGGLGQPSRTTLETTVMEHEFGHLLGLVNVGTEMVTPHQDSAHGAHCTQTACLMYYAVDSSDFVANLVGGSVPTLDAACRADLTAKGGR